MAHFIVNDVVALNIYLIQAASLHYHITNQLYFSGFSRLIFGPFAL